MSGNLVEDLFDALCDIPIIDPHSHIDPRAPVSKSLDDLLNYHYYTELAHSAGMSKDLLAADADPKLRVAEIIRFMDKFDNTAQYAWFLEIAQEFLGYSGTKIALADTDKLWNLADRTFAAKTWEDTVFKRTRLEAIFLTNEFDDSLEGFDTARYVPCLRTDTLVFRLHEPEVKARLARVTGIEVGDAASLDEALLKVFETFVRKSAKACAISLPPGFTPSRDAHPMSPEGIFRAIAGKCRDFSIPFDLMIGVKALPGVPTAVAVRATGLNAAAEKFHPALLLPAVQALQSHVCLLLPAGWFKAGRVLDMHAERPAAIKLSSLEERGADFERCAFGAT